MVNPANGPTADPNPSFFTTPALEGNYAWSGPNSQMSVVSSQPSNPTSSVNPVMEPANQGDLSLLDETASAANYADRLRVAFNQSWQMYEHFEMQRRSMAMAQGTTPRIMGTPSVYATGQPGLPYTQAGGTLPQGSVPVAPQRGYPFMPQPAFSFQAPADTQRVSNIGLNAYPLPLSRPNPQAVPADAATAIALQRRRQTLNATSTDATTAAGQPPVQASTPNPRRRARRADDPGLHHSRRPSPPRFEGRTSQAAAVQYSDLASSAIRNYASYSMLHAQQRAAIDQRLHIDNLLRGMRPEDAEAFRAYQEDLLQRRRALQEQAAAPAAAPAAAEPPPPSKGLDNMNDGRPEPKETEEMMVNLECKACMSQLVDTVILPCGHAILCRWCADQHMPSSRTDKTRPKGHATCPMCRKPVKQKVGSAVISPSILAMLTAF